MSSTSIVNFSIRQNKAIERSLVFSSLRQLLNQNSNLDYVYVGLGSVWFVDFDMAHRELGIETMFSLEHDEVVYRRAVFNAPYRTIEVVLGPSQSVLPSLMEDRPELLLRPWIVWLDYDHPLDDARLSELNDLVFRLPSDSVLLTTFNAYAGSYERNVAERRQTFIDLFGDSFPTEEFQTDGDFKNVDKVSTALAVASINRLQSHALQIARPGGFLPAFQLRYQDGSPMVTIGGCLPSPGRAASTAALVASPVWGAVCADAIATPPLTVKEVQALRSLMPRNPLPSRADVQALGFDLEEHQVASFATHYSRFPMFIEAVR